MTTLETLAVVEEVKVDPQLNNSEALPFFYSVPCAGVRYYTYDFRPALQKRIEGWGADDEEET